MLALTALGRLGGGMLVRPGESCQRQAYLSHGGLNRNVQLRPVHRGCRVARPIPTSCQVTNQDQFIFQAIARRSHSRGNGAVLHPGGSSRSRIRIE